MAGWLNDPEVVRYSEQRHFRHSEETQAVYLHMMGENLKEIHVGQNFIGTIAAHVDKNNSVANVGILIGEKTAWRKGYGEEAWTAFCDHLLSHGIRKVEAGCMAINFGMIHICRKYRMFFEGNREGHFLCGGELIDMIMWGKFGG